MGRTVYGGGQRSDYIEDLKKRETTFKNQAVHFMQNKCCHLEKLSSNPSTETAIRHIAVVEEDRGRKRKRLEGCIYVFYDKDSRSVTLQLWLTDYIKLTTTFFYEMFR